jgi:hypothetical protein
VGAQCYTQLERETKRGCEIGSKNQYSQIKTTQIDRIVKEIIEMNDATENETITQCKSDRLFEDNNSASAVRVHGF